MNVVMGLGIWLREFLFGRAAVATEILALRQQLVVLQRQSKRPQLRRETPTWSVPRIHAELTLLGYSLSEATVAK